VGTLKMSAHYNSARLYVPPRNRTNAAAAATAAAATTTNIATTATKIRQRSPRQQCLAGSILMACVFVAMVQYLQTRQALQQIGSSAGSNLLLENFLGNRFVGGTKSGSNLLQEYWWGADDDDDDDDDDGSTTAGTTQDDDNQFQDDFYKNNVKRIKEEEEEEERALQRRQYQQPGDRGDRNLPETSKSNEHRASGGKHFQDVYLQARKQKHQKAQERIRKHEERYSNTHGFVQHDMPPVPPVLGDTAAAAAAVAVANSDGSGKDSLTYEELLDQQQERILQRQKNRLEAQRGRLSSYRQYKDWTPPPVEDTMDLFATNDDGKRILPDMTTSRAGIIFFLHVPKTGGQTIRQFSFRFRKHLKQRLIKDRRAATAATAGGGGAGDDDVDVETKYSGLLFGSGGRKQMRKWDHFLAARRRPQQYEAKGRRRRLEGATRPPDHPLPVELYGRLSPPSLRGQRKKSAPASPEQQELLALTKSKMRYVAANTLQVFREQALPQINEYFRQLDTNNTISNDNKNQTSKPRKILFVEVHGMDNYNALELEPYLHYWRQQSKVTEIPFFAFTLLREAVSMQVSFFNFYYIHPGDFRFCNNPLKPNLDCSKARQNFDRQRRDPIGRPHPIQLHGKYKKIQERQDQGMEITGSQREILQYVESLGGIFGEQDRPKENHVNGIQNVSHERLEEVLLQVSYSNPQCLFLARGERAYGDDADQKMYRLHELRRTECQETYLSLQRTMDWIGRTDTLSTETLPLLTKIMFGKGELGKHMPKANTSPQQGGYVKLDKCSAATRKGLERISQLDQELYHRASQDFTMDQWGNFTDLS